MTQIIPFTPRPLAERKQAVRSFNSALVQGVSAGFPVISIKGKVWTIVKGDDRKIVTRKNEDGDEEAVRSIDVVLVAANANLSRTYYVKGFEEGSDAKPDCYSNDGKTPAADAQSPQAKSCASCPHAAYGSKITDAGKKGWACANFRRMAVASPARLDEPMLLRAPGASLKGLAKYASDLDAAGYQFDEVVTKIGFDMTVAHPQLTFKAVGVLPESAVAELREQAAGDVVGQIIGVIDMPSYDSPAAVPDSVADLPVREKKVDAPVKSEAAAELDEAVEKVEAKATKPKKAVKVEEPVDGGAGAEDAVASDIGSLLSGVSFDD